jgi:putative addiction module component (TIGR02574 family)
MNSKKLRNLPIDERIRLVQDLWDSISADQNQLSLTDEQKEELDRRIDAFEADKNKGRLAKDVLADVRQKL